VVNVEQILFRNERMLNPAEAPARSGLADSGQFKTDSISQTSGRRPHSSLDGTTPDQAYFNSLPLRSAA
jgi:hypothetical protein